MAKKKDSATAQHRRRCGDVEKMKALAVSAFSDAFHCEPIDVLEMLLTFGKYDENDREEIIDAIADEIYPPSDEGHSAISLFIRRARRKSGVPVQE